MTTGKIFFKHWQSYKNTSKTIKPNISFKIKILETKNLDLGYFSTKAGPEVGLDLKVLTICLLNFGF